jgi:hypothetical protein
VRKIKDKFISFDCLLVGTEGAMWRDLHVRRRKSFVPLVGDKLGETHSPKNESNRHKASWT